MIVEWMPTCIKLLWYRWLKDLQKTGTYIPFPIEQYFYRPNCRKIEAMEEGQGAG